MLGDDACHHVGGAARGETHHHGDGLAGVVLGQRRDRGDEGAQGQGECLELHEISLLYPGADGTRG
ncbi:hypothetical protein D3C72_2298240 [compost metagenome]